MTQHGILAATFTEVPWLPPGSRAEVWLGDEPLPLDACTSAFALPFGDDGRLLLTNVLKRGLDIPGGHVEPDRDADAEAAAVRETDEETGAAVRILGKVGHLKLVVPDPPPGYRYGSVSYQPFYAALVESIGPVKMPHECGPPGFHDPEEAAALPQFAMHAALIMAAAEMARAAAPSGAPGRG